MEHFKEQFRPIYGAASKADIRGNSFPCKGRPRKYKNVLCDSLFSLFAGKNGAFTEIKGQNGAPH